MVEKSMTAITKQNTMKRKPSEKELRLRKELAERTVKLNPHWDELHVGKEDVMNSVKFEHHEDSPDENLDAIAETEPEELGPIVKDISSLVRDEKLEEAMEELEKRMIEYPDEPRLYSLKMVIEMLDRPFNDYERIKRVAGDAMEVALKKNAPSHVSAVLNNMGILALSEGFKEYSKIFYLAAYFVNKNALSPLENIIGWCSRYNELEEAMTWVEKLIKKFPNWTDNEDIISFFTKDESLHNLRKYSQFQNIILSQIEKLKTRNIENNKHR